jgi:hypothetical protein
MPAVMTYLRSLLLMILAVLALTGPSLAVGAAAVSVREVPLAVTLADDEARATAFHSCQRQGGKGLPACYPDLGPLALAAGQPLWTSAGAPVPAVVPMLRKRSPNIEPPPPRHR